MDCTELKSQIEKAPAKSRVLLDQIYMYSTVGDKA